MIGRRSPQGVRASVSRPAFSGFDVSATGRGGHPFPLHVAKRRIFRAISPLPEQFSGISGGVPVIGHVRAAAKYRAGGDQGLAWRDAFAGWQRECALTSLSIC